MIRALRLVGVLAACGAMASCGTSGGILATQNRATVGAVIMDAPFSLGGATVSAVNVSLEKIELIGSGGKEILSSFSPPRQINLLDYQSTVFNLGSASVSAGPKQQFRLVLDTSADDTSIVVNGVTYPLTIPSASGPFGFGGHTATDGGDGQGTSGIKVDSHFTAQAGATYGFILDFNAAESILQTGQGAFMMKPVLVATAQATSGTIVGAVTNSVNNGPVANAEVLASQSGQAINSGVTDSNGNFRINALPPGTYTVMVNNTWTNQAGQAMTATNGNGAGPFTDANINVLAGQSTTVNFSE